MFAAIPPSSPVAIAVLVFCFILVLAFEVSNGFHDTANAVATVIHPTAWSRSRRCCCPAL
jgi:inorganic phosphate transporter, PiT family